MVRIIAQYRVKEESLELVLAAIRKFVARLSLAEPKTMYHTYRIENSLDFLHVMSFKDEFARQRHHDAEYTREFAETLYTCCDGEPKFSDIELIR